MLKAVLVALAALYPLVLAFGQSWITPRWMALGLAGVALLRCLLGRGRGLSALWALGALALAAFAWAGNSVAPLKLYPILVNALLLLVFGASLVRPPCVVERLARLQDPALPEAAIPYVRRVTEVWCAFFVLNGAISAATALWASDALWALYNGCLAYLAIGLLFGIEWYVRQRAMRRVSGV